MDEYDFRNLFGEAEDVIVVAAGKSLFQKGDAAKSMYVVRAGSISVHDGATVFETVGPGGVVGEMAIVDGSPRSAGARAEVASEVIAVDQKRFLAMIERTPYFAVRIMHVLTERLRHTNVMMARG